MSHSFVNGEVKIINPLEISEVFIFLTHLNTFEYQQLAFVFGHINETYGLKFRHIVFAAKCFRRSLNIFSENLNLKRPR